VVGIGDSVTAGTNCDCEAFIGLYATDLASTRGLKTSSVNLGVAGWTSSRLLDEPDQARLVPHDKHDIPDKSRTHRTNGLYDLSTWGSSTGTDACLDLHALGDGEHLGVGARGSSSCCQPWLPLSVWCVQA
jgi:hypothetical protein